MRAAHAASLRARRAALRRPRSRAAVARPRSAARGSSPRCWRSWPQTVWFAAARARGRDRPRARQLGDVSGGGGRARSHADRPPVELRGPRVRHLPRSRRTSPRRSAPRRFVITCTEDNRALPARPRARRRPRAHPHRLPRRRPLGGARNARARAGADLQLLAVGTLRDCKGFDTLIQTVALLRARRRRRRGSRSSATARTGRRSSARRAARARRARHVHRLPAARGARRALRARDACSCTRRASANHFGIPNVILEAQAARVPVVCTQLPSLAELIEDGVSGVFVPEDDVERARRDAGRGCSPIPARRAPARRGGLPPRDRALRHRAHGGAARRAARRARRAPRRAARRWR